ncbi:hypothetical protein DFS34DRAFT_365398 [Phlyctochytrium arcticum]|nr:hypothetical protein DFS34DRAFT_365398 [Phlyctochytrium arcticum]
MRLHLQIPQMTEKESVFLYKYRLDDHIRECISTNKVNLETLASIRSAALRLSGNGNKKQLEEALVVNQPQSAARKSGPSKTGKRQPKKAPTSVTCSICDKEGHYTHKCLELPARKAKCQNRAAVASFSQSEQPFLIDSGASRHMVSSKNLLENYEKSPSTVSLGDRRDGIRISYYW